ncbi:MAG: squalene/phytoene synthase family protein, partial [Pararhodobacter sp.]
VTQEPLIAHMRLQFWREVIALEDPRAHEVAAPLQALVRAGLPLMPLQRMIDAREVEIGTKAPFADDSALWDYLDGTAGALMQASVLALGGPQSPAAGGCGAAQGLANYLLAIPALQAAGRLPLPDGRPEAVAALAREGLARLAGARVGLRGLPRAALLAGWRAAPLLKQAALAPGRVGEGTLGQSEFARRGGLLWQTLRGTL